MLGGLSLHYWRQDFSRDEWMLFYADYIEDLQEYPREMIQNAMKVYRKKPDAKWFPKIGELIAIIDPAHKSLMRTAADLRSRLTVPEPDNRPDKATRKSGADWGRRQARSMSMSNPRKLPPERLTS